MINNQEADQLKYYNWYIKEIEKLSKIIWWNPKGRIIEIDIKSILTNDISIRKYAKWDIPEIIRFSWKWIDLYSAYWINENKFNKMRTFIFFLREFIKEDWNKKLEIIQKYGSYIGRENF